VKRIRYAFHFSALLGYTFADLQLDDDIREVAPCNLICDVH